MAHLIEDLVGFTGQRSYVVIPAASLTPNNVAMHSLVADTIASTLQSVGWTILTGPTSSSNGNEYTLYSAQAPWYDHNNIPSWYVGARAYLRIWHRDSGAINFDFGEYYNGAAVNISTENFFLSASAYAAGLEMRMLGNPYELWIQSNQTTNNANGMYFGTLNVPKPVQQQSRVISSLLATKFTSNNVLMGSTQYSCFRVKDAAAVVNDISNPGNASPQFMTVAGFVPFSGNPANARRIWNRVSDEFQDTPATGKPFVLPAQVAYRIATSGTELTFNGLLWDSFVLTESLARNAILEFINKQFICHASSLGTGISKPASLMVNIGDI